MVISLLLDQQQEPSLTQVISSLKFLLLHTPNFLIKLGQTIPETSSAMQKTYATSMIAVIIENIILKISFLALTAATISLLAQQITCPIRKTLLDLTYVFSISEVLETTYLFWETCS